MQKSFHFINKHSVLSLSRQNSSLMRNIHQRIQEIDFGAAEASSQEDRRKIMQAIEPFELAPRPGTGGAVLRGISALSSLVKDFLSNATRVEAVEQRRELVQQIAHGTRLRMLEDRPQGMSHGSVFEVLGEASGGHCWKVQVGDRKERLRKDKEGIWWQWA